eukprot:GHVQ01023574.1.p1 GENE.GHVQ01023574.1~~GHVQ01023574.1.p1  ORF type:complete len:337 (-),score=54.51 GHVQ01023574.1:414-1424(-)
MPMRGCRRKKKNMVNNLVSPALSFHSFLAAERADEVDHLLKLRGMQQASERKALEKECELFRQEQRKNKPQEFQDSIPQHTGPSSLLVMDGEDRGWANRKSLSQQLQREWIDAQRKVESDRKAEAKVIDRNWAEKQQGFAQLQQVTEASIHQERQSAQRKVSEENKRLATERMKAVLQVKESEQLRNAKELKRNLQDPFLADGRVDMENPSDADGVTDGDSMVLGTLREGFKGMPMEAKQQYLRDNFSLCEHKRDQKQRNQEEEESWARQIEYARKISIAVERDTQRRQQKLVSDTLEANRSLQREQQQRKDALNRSSHEAGISEDYHKYFGTSSR